MLIKLSSKNQVTVPRKILAKLPNTKYFEVDLDNGALVLKPVEVIETKLEQIQQKMIDLGLNEDSVAEAVRWARSGKGCARYKHSRVCAAVWRPTRPS